MGKLVVITLLIAGLLAVVAWRVQRMSKAQRDRDANRKRWVIGDNQAERIPLAPDAGPNAETATPIFVGKSTEPLVPPETGSEQQERTMFLSSLDDPPSSSGLDESPLPPPARLVMTPDGEMVLTAPPFTLRQSILPGSAAALLHVIAGKLPAGMVLCPRVRLESLVEPTSPAERDPDDWRQWRRRVRLRSVDAAICRLEPSGWRPVLAIEIDPPPSISRNIAPDRIVDDVLEAAGLAVVHVDALATPEQAWTLISTRLQS